MSDKLAHYKSRYQKLQKLGEGSYGSVFKAIDRISGEFVAIKKMHD
jgi:cyclin-dependent kinase 1/cyclin-dependent kinase 2